MLKMAQMAADQASTRKPCNLSDSIVSVLASKKVFITLR